MLDVGYHYNKSNYILLSIYHIINGEEMWRRMIKIYLTNIRSNKHSACQTCLYERPILSVAQCATLLNVTAAITV